MNIAQWIDQGRAVLGMELGSTRIKAVLTGPDHAPVAGGDFTWENKLENGVWTYDLDDAWKGMQCAFAALKKDVLDRFGVRLEKLAAIGISGMMHGYLPFDGQDQLLTPFRTWRNTMTAEAAEELTARFGFNIPQRWSAAHLYQAMLKREEHVSRIAHLTTLAGYIHWKLTGERVMGIGEAAGMFPVDAQTGDYDAGMLNSFDELTQSMGYSWKLRQLLPCVRMAGEEAGVLTAEGAKLLDPAGDLQPGIPFCPPEGDAGTGMTATNSVAVRRGNVSAGTSVFAMIVLEKPLSRVYPEIDVVATPAGKPVAMVHCNNCTSDLNAWAGMLKGFADAAGRDVSMGEIYTAIFNAALDGEKDCGGVVNVPLLSGEHTIGLEAGRPMLVRTPEARLSFANFARSLVCGAVCSLRKGMEILAAEQVQIDSLLGHGGYFKTPQVGQKMLAAALDVPVSVMETAGEGGPWGMALLAAYRVYRKPGQTLEAYLNDEVFSGAAAVTAQPDAEDTAGFNAYAARFAAALEAEKAAVDYIRE